MIGVVDHEKFLAYVPSKTVDLGVTPGVPVPPHDQQLQNALKGIPSEGRIPVEAYGKPFFGKTIPIKEGDVVVGALGIGYNIEDQVLLEETMEKLSQIISQLNDRVHTIAAHAQELAATTEEIAKNSTDALEQAAQTSKVVEYIRNVAKQTNLLGLNAAIEAARAGAQGATFSVVAREIRNMSSDSAKAADDIEAFLTQLRSNIESMSGVLQEITSSNLTQAQLVEDFSMLNESLENVATTLKEYVERVTMK